MNHDPQGKIKSQHLRRNAYLYVRQSTLRQVMENSESTERQYALRQRAIQLGWHQEQIVVIDNDLGQSGASASDRMGFQRLVSEVGMARAGIVMGLEVSRLARNSADWHRLLEMCALTDTLILDEDGFYDPAYFNDRLLLGLKGTMSEAELHVLKARLQGGIVNKARRGELLSPLPIGLQYGFDGQVKLDPDRQIQESVRVFFKTYQRTGSATTTVKAFREQGLLFPHRVHKGPNKGEILWKPLLHSRALFLLHNPRYAGAFFYGRTRQRKGPHGGVRHQKLQREDWTVFIPEAHVGYISLEQFEENQRRLLENAQACGTDRKRSPPREGPALLQGIVLCGRCGSRMTIRYHKIRERLVPDYVCQHAGIERAEPCCQIIPGAGLEKVIGALLIETVTPLTLKVALSVDEELKRRRDEVEGLRQKHIERLRYDADMAKRRYMQVDPDNRLVADELEGEWNKKLRAHKEALENMEEQKRALSHSLSQEQRARIMALAKDFPNLWNNPQTPSRERKRMVRLLIEDVTLIKDCGITAHVRFKGGTTRTINLPPPPPIEQLRKNPAHLVAEVDRLIDDYTHGQIAAILTHKGMRTVDGAPLKRLSIRNIQQAYGLVSRYDRLRNRGMLTMSELAEQFGVATATVKNWNQAGFLRSHLYSDRNDYLFEPMGDAAPVKGKHKGLMASLRQMRNSRKITLQNHDEVQYEV
ncbi:MAG: recombinase family protein [Proteobacteria bacterium]|nr:recombinase family protein [Pseudomonadota bacterium]